MELEHECFLLEQQHLEEQVDNFQQDYFPSTNDLVNQPTLMALEETQTPLTFTSTEANVSFMVIEEQSTDFAMAESFPPFLHGTQSCELIATGLPYHMSIEAEPSHSIWNTDQQSIYYRPPSLTPPELRPITASHRSVQILVGLSTM